MADGQKLPLWDQIKQLTGEDPIDNVNIVVGGEAITFDKMEGGEKTTEHALERGWLAAIGRAHKNQSFDEIQRASNVREIAHDAIRRGVLTREQVINKLDELFDPIQPDKTKTQQAARDTIRAIATKLASANDLTRAEVAARADLVVQQQQLQDAINTYRHEARAAGKDDQTISGEIDLMLTTAGLRYTRT